MVFLKFHDYPEGKVLAIADKELIGKKFGDFFINPSFYKSKKAEKEELQTLINSCNSINITGKKALSLLKEYIEIPDEIVILINSEIPHCIIYKI